MQNEQDIARIAAGLTKEERDAFLLHRRTTEERWLIGDCLGQKGCELLYHRSLTLELNGLPPLWERRAQNSVLAGVVYSYRPGAILGLALRDHLIKQDKSDD